MPTPLPNLTVAQLSYLVAAVDEATWREAAEQVGVSQSGFSQGIAELERRLGINLFERDGRNKVPTPLAAPVVTHARTTLAATADLARWAERVRHGHGGQLRVGMIDAAAIDHYPDHLRAHRDAHDDLDLLLRVAPSSQLLAELRAGELDLAVCVRPTDANDLVVTHLTDETLRAYPPVDVDPSAPWGPWVTFPEGSLTRALIATTVREQHQPFEVVAESHQPEVLKEMVHLGLGWTYLPDSQATREPRPLVAHGAAPTITRQIVAVRRDTAAPQPAVDELVARLTGEPYA